MYVLRTQKIKLEINYTRKIGNFTNMWKLNNVLLNHWLVKEEIERENSQHFELNEMKAHHTKTYGMQIKSCLEGNLKL